MCATTAVVPPTLSMLRGPGSVAMCRTTRPVAGSTATTCDSRSAVTSASGVPPTPAAPGPPRARTARASGRGEERAAIHPTHIRGDGRCEVPRTLWRVRRALLVLALVGAALAVAAPACRGRLAAAPGRRDVDVPVGGHRRTRPRATTEKVWVASTAARTFTLGWTSADKSLGNPRARSRAPGRCSFQDTGRASSTREWSSTPPPATTSRSSAPTPSELRQQPREHLLQRHLGQRARRRSPSRSSSASRGRAAAARATTSRSTNKVVGLETVTVPAFKRKLLAVRVDSRDHREGGDAFGSGTRTVWWVWGIGPVLDRVHARRRARRRSPRRCSPATSLPPWRRRTSTTGSRSRRAGRRRTAGRTRGTSTRAGRGADRLDRAAARFSASTCRGRSRCRATTATR